MFKAIQSSFSVKDLEGAKEFYGGKLGLDAKLDNMGLVISAPGGSVFIYNKDDHQPATYTVLNLITDNIEAAVDDLSGKGILFERYEDMPFKQDERGIARGLEAKMGPDIAWFKDPEGNILAVMQPE